MKTKHFLLTWLLGWLMVMPMATMAQEPQEQDASSLQNVVAVYQLDGQKALFAFADQPEVTYTATDLVLTTTKTSVQYPISQLKKIQFETADMPEGIDEVEADQRFSFRDGSIVIEGGEPNSLVNIYTVSGALMAQYRLDSNGDAVIPMQGIRGNAYIFANGSITFKFIAQ